MFGKTFLIVLRGGRYKITAFLKDNLLLIQPYSMKMMLFGGGYYSILKVNCYRETRCVLPINIGGVACSLLLSAGGINSYTRQLVKLQAR